MPGLSSVCVFCGARAGERAVYAEAARGMGAALAERGLELVYGGGRVGLMGSLADAVLARGGRAIGVIPKALAHKEVAHDGLTRLEVVDSMHARKARMAELSDAFVALPGGFGTLEELFEVLSWRQLDLHRKPVVLYDVAGYWQPLLAVIDHLCAEGFTSPAQRDLLRVARTLDEVFEQVERAD